MNPPSWNTPIPTALGEFEARWTERGLSALRFPGAANPVQVFTPLPPRPRTVSAWIPTLRDALVAALTDGRATPLPPLDLTAGTDFQREVWLALRAIPRGETRGYGEVAVAVGRPRAAQAVGQACGANPIPILIPCHRVVAAHSRLGGFSGGLDWKRRLLGLERSRDFPFSA